MTSNTKHLTWAARRPAGMARALFAAISAAVLPALLLAVALVARDAAAMTVADREALSADISAALQRMGLRPQDCRIRHDYATPDAFRLPLVDSLMYRPTSLSARIDGLATRVEAESTLSDMARDICLELAVEPCMELPGGAGTTPGPAGRMRDVRGMLAHLPPGLRVNLGSYSGQLARLALLREAALADVKPHLAFLRDNSTFLVTPREDYQDYEDIDPFELDQMERTDTALGDSILSLATRIHRPYIEAMSKSAVRAADDLVRFVEHFATGEDCRCPARRSARYNGGRATFAGRTSTATGKIMYIGITDQGPVVVGGWGANIYSGAFALIIDMGGDDSYNLASDPAVNFSLIVDKQGDDGYRSAEDAAVAGAILGTSMVVDLGGNDTYTAGGVSLGAAIYGCGILYDRDGEDRYTSECFSQGAGFLGIGILWDRAGNDAYTAGMQSQAFGYVGGAGLIVEGGGNDTYFTKMSQTDILRYDDHYLTLSQGCAFGYRPDYSGGIGLLLEGGGNDLYSSDIFGQGVGYWFCVGAIVDRGGHDCYRSYQYAQGAGIHLAFGLVLDQGGDDYYVSKGVSQGCGHDLSLGLLADLSGNDCYTAVDLSQGAGSANGTGVLYDADGVDSYSSKSEVNVSGYGDYRREFGSIGLQVDARGADFYSARGENQALWESGRYGLGCDLPGEAAKPRGDIVVKEYPFQERAFTTEELYILAMRSEPRFQAWKKFGFDRMVADSVASIEYMRTVLDTKDATKRHATKDILVKIGTPAVPMLSDAVRSGNDLAKGEAGWILGLIEHPGGFDALIDLSRSQDWKLRSGAVNSLARLKGLDADAEAALLERLTAILGDTAEVFYVRKDAAFAAGNRGYCDLAPLLANCFDDPHYSVRFSAAEALRQMSKAGAPADPAAKPCSDVVRSLTGEITNLDAIGLVAALYAAGDLPPSGRMDVAEAALALPQSREAEVSIALAKLLRPVAPATPAEKARLEALKAKLPQGSWEVDSFVDLKSEGRAGK
ncbi:MAG: hypothetical protein WAW06_10845 [bacterium]